MSHKLRQNIIIYGSLIIAGILLVFVAKEYYDNKGSEEPVLKELEEILGNKNNEDNNGKKEKNEKEPGHIKDVDKKEVINTYMDDILNRRINDELLTYDVLITWGEYEITNIEYVKRITDNYYAYDVSIKIPNKDAIVVGRTEDKLYDGGYIITEVEFDLALNENGVIVKNVND